MNDDATGSRPASTGNRRNRGDGYYVAHWANCCQSDESWVWKPIYKWAYYWVIPRD